MTVNVSSLNELSNIYPQQYTKEVADSIQRLNTGLKINETADDTAAAIISTSLRANASSLSEGLQNASKGYGLIEVSNKALDYQEEILEKIKDRLELAQTDDASTRDSLRENIQSLIEEFDKIASSTSYNEAYTLQQSSSVTSASQEISINFTSDTSVITPSIRSNSEGVNLSTLKNLSSGELTLDEVSNQLETIDTALETLDEYKDEFALTKEQLGINVTNLETIEEGNKNSELSLTQANLAQEEIIFDKYKLLTESSSFALIQANTTQAAVLDLLTTIPDYEPSSKEDDSTNFGFNSDDNNDFNSFEYEPTNNLNNNTFSNSNSTTFSSDATN